ncbi:MAG: hypothetical protein ACRC9L_02110 [Brevinema sp.]
MIVELLYQLAIPLRQTSAVFRALFTAIAKECDILLDYAKSLTFQCFPKYADDILPFALERGVTQIRGESLASFSHRTEKAFSFCTASSTREGIIQLVKTFTLKPFTMREIWQDNWTLASPTEKLGLTTQLGGVQSANTFVLSFSSLLFKEKEYIHQIIELYKPAHIRCIIIANIQDDWVLGIDEEKLGKNTYLN